MNAAASRSLSTFAESSLRGPHLASPPLPRVGDVLLDRYSIEQVLGEGGMGVVYRARHLSLGQFVALKVLRPERVSVSGALRRFLREARVAASLRGPHAVRVFDVGVLPTGLPFMVMELLEGVDLEEHLATQGPLSVREACSLIRDAALALTEAHTLGCVHRDLKPANLFLAQDDGRTVLKVLDFGITKVGEAESGARTLTAPDVLLGSPPYMSPEQVRNARRVDARSDVWSLGVILYELLTAVSPFEGESSPHVFALITTAKPQRPSEHVRSIPRELDLVVMQCLEKRVDDRIGSARELADKLATFATPTTPHRPQRNTLRQFVPAAALVAMVSMGATHSPPPATLLSHGATQLAHAAASSSGAWLASTRTMAAQAVRAETAVVEKPAASSAPAKQLRGAGRNVPAPTAATVPTARVRGQDLDAIRLLE